MVKINKHLWNVKFSDLDECQDDPDLCGAYAECVNFDGFFDCQCFPGFQQLADGYCQGKLMMDIYRFHIFTADCNVNFKTVQNLVYGIVYNWLIGLD